MRNIINQIKRTILVVEDELINQEILREILGTQYDILTATNGLEAINELTTSLKPISLIVLDLNMPTMNGIEFLKKIKEYNIKSIPVIVITSEADMEVLSLKLGAADFIKKPFEMPDIIRARVDRAIEVFENKLIISLSERDELTQVYNKNIFKEYMKRIEEYNPREKMDLNVLRISNYQIVNEIYGKEKTDEIIKNFSFLLKNEVKKISGIVGKLEDDYFMMYHKHINDYENVINEFIRVLEEEYEISGLNLKVGVYEIEDKNIDADTRINRAKFACDQVGNYSKTHYLLFNTVDQKETLRSEQLIHDFPNSLKNKEFSVYYQAKYNVEGEYYLSSAEALVRWNHKEFGQISPALFIKLFEERGLIRDLDKYVWEEAIKDLAKWRDEGIKIVPVSLNVSRIDLLDDSIVDIFDNLLKKYNIDSKYVYLEITESASENNMTQLISTIEKLRKLGFKIEIDDFGAGYSSLNVLATIPFDVLKVDMLFVRQMYNNEKSLKMLEIVADIARYLNVLLVAEGVETKEQLEQLKKYGYQIIQGYYFSKPLKNEEFYKLLGGKDDNN